MCHADFRNDWVAWSQGKDEIPVFSPGLDPPSIAATKKPKNNTKTGTPYPPTDDAHSNRYFFLMRDLRHGHGAEKEHLHHLLLFLDTPPHKAQESAFYGTVVPCTESCP